MPPKRADVTPDLGKIRKAAGRPRRERLRIIIASDPQRPVRTFVLPRAAPVVAAVGALLLVITTVVLFCGSWRTSDALSRLERRFREVLDTADVLASRSRRGGGGAATAGGSAPLLAIGGNADLTLRPPSGQAGRFVIESVNTGETMEIRLDLARGEVEPESYRQLRHLLRCQRTGAETPFDPRLIELLYRISQRTGQKIQLVSGFRAPMYSLAKLSYHTRGMAADIRIPGMTALMVRDLAVSMGVKGIGYYPVSQFVHVDVRDERSFWTDYGKDRQDSDGAEHGPEHGESADLAEE